MRNCLTVRAPEEFNESNLSTEKSETKFYIEREKSFVSLQSIKV